VGLGKNDLNNVCTFLYIIRKWHVLPLLRLARELAKVYKALPIIEQATIA
jgi:hypothetical protein